MPLKRWILTDKPIMYIHNRNTTHAGPLTTEFFDQYIYIIERYYSPNLYDFQQQTYNSYERTANWNKKSK